MKSIEKLKQETTDTIEEKLKKESDRINHEKNVILNSNSLPEILTALVNIYGNTIEQGKLQASFIREMTKSDFFENATCSVKTNHIVFENKIYEIIFPKSYSKTIVVKRRLEHFIPRRPHINEATVEIAESYLSQKESGTINYDSFIDFYLMKTKNKKPNILNRIKTKEKDVKNMLEFLLKTKEDYDRIYSHWLKEMEKLKEEKELDIKFFETIEEDLEEFKKNDWNVQINLESYQMKVALQNMFE